MIRRRSFNAGLLAASSLPMPGLIRSAGAQTAGRKGGDVVMAQQAQKH